MAVISFLLRCCNRQHDTDMSGDLSSSTTTLTHQSPIRMPILSTKNLVVNVLRIPRDIHLRSTPANRPTNMATYIQQKHHDPLRCASQPVYSKPRSPKRSISSDFYHRNSNPISPRAPRRKRRNPPPSAGMELSFPCWRAGEGLWSVSWC